MNEQTLKLLQAAMTTEALTSAVSEQTGNHAIPLPDNMKLCSLEAYKPQRLRFRGVFDTHLIADFVEYANEHATGEASGVKCPVFVNSESMSAAAFFDLGNEAQPGHADHRARLELRRTAEFKEALSFDGRKKNQRDLAEWMEDWAPNITVLDSDREPLELSRAIAAVRKIQISAKSETTSETQSFSGRKSSMDEIEAKDAEKLPAVIAFHCTPYHGLRGRTLEFRMSLLTQSCEFVPRLVRLDDLMEAMGEELSDRLGEGLSDALVLYSGNFDAGR